MNFLTIGLGILSCGYAILVLILRLKGRDERFKKLKPMKEKFGEKVGSTIHYIGYVLIPFLLGLILIYNGFWGLSIKDIIK